MPLVMIWCSSATIDGLLVELDVVVVNVVFEEPTGNATGHGERLVHVLTVLSR